MTEPSSHDEAIAEAFWLAHAKDVQSEIVGEFRAQLAARGLRIVEAADDQRTLTIIARSIGRTMHTENFHARAQNVIDSLLQENMAIPQPSRIAEAGGTGKMAGLSDPSSFEIERAADIWDKFRGHVIVGEGLAYIFKDFLAARRAALSKLPEPRPEMTERDWGGAAQAAARKVMTLFGWRQEPSNEPGDVMRDKIAALFQQAIDGASAKPEAIGAREKALREAAEVARSMAVYPPSEPSTMRAAIADAILNLITATKEKVDG